MMSQWLMTSIGLMERLQSRLRTAKGTTLHWQDRKPAGSYLMRCRRRTTEGHPYQI